MKTKNSHEFVHKALVRQMELKHLKEDDLVVVMAGNFGDKFGASFIEISPIKLLLNRY